MSQATRAILKEYQEDVQRTAGAEGRGPLDRSSMVVVLNKADKAVLQGAIGSGVTEIDATNAPNTPWPCPSLQVSCVTGQGLEDLEVYLGKTVTSLLSVTAGGAGVGGGYGEGQGALITRERHRSHVKSCVRHLDVFLASQRRWERAASSSLDGRDEGEEEEEDDGVEEAVYLDAAAEELRYTDGSTFQPFFPLISVLLMPHVLKCSLRSSQLTYHSNHALPHIASYLH